VSSPTSTVGRDHQPILCSVGSLTSAEFLEKQGLAPSTATLFFLLFKKSTHHATYGVVGAFFVLKNVKN
jgi:di/tricarboxylate transporter